MHTPGPWRVADLRHQQNGQLRIHNSGCASANALARNSQAESNARLIAAAPDLLALLQEADDLLPRVSEDDPIASALADWMRKARAAIARATAEQAKGE